MTPSFLEDRFTSVGWICAVRLRWSGRSSRSFLSHPSAFRSCTLVRFLGLRTDAVEGLSLCFFFGGEGHREQPYVHLHVTLLTTTSPSLNASYFSLPPSSSIPSTILTTLSTQRTDPSSPKPEFNSITYHGETAEGSGEWVVKIFSESRREEGWLEEVFGGRVGWVFRKEWEAYPLSVFLQTSHPVSPLLPSLRFGAATLAFVREC